VRLDPEHCYELVKARDARFDGVFFVGVSTTGVYCRPVCRVRTPGKDRCSYFTSAASAEAAGFRPCLRCRPELAPGAAPVDAVARLASDALVRIEAGALNHASVEDLASELGISSRQLHRVIESQYGVSPLDLSRTRRLLLAKQLLTDTSLRVIDVALASGFGSVRQFNRQFRESYRMNPLSLRKRQRVESSETVRLKLGFHAPLPWAVLVGFFTGRGSPRVESLEGAAYLRTVQLGEHRGYLRAAPLGPNLLGVEVSASLLPVLAELRARLRRAFDLDANPSVIDAFLQSHPELRTRVESAPGLRIPGSLSGFELALRAVLGQQISVKAATTVFGRFVDVFGAPVQTPYPQLDRSAPDASAVADATLQQLIDRGLNRRRAECVQALARAVADGKLRLDPPADAQHTRQALQELPGIGPWTAEYVAMRALGDPDAFPHQDLGLLQALKLNRPAELLARAEAWRPFRAYAAVHLWHGYSRGG
jgi:AraC family transcriptional regulator of adaptative response / DNA-3-methyladenine glycosylase II